MTNQPAIVLRRLLASFERTIEEARAQLTDSDPYVASFARIRLDLHTRWAAETRAQLEDTRDA